MPVKEGGGGEVDGFRGITWFKRGTEGVSRRQQSMKGGGTKKLTANYLPMRRDHNNTTEPYKGIRSFYRDDKPKSSDSLPSLVISNDQSLNQSKYLRLLDTSTSDLFLLLN